MEKRRRYWSVSIKLWFYTTLLILGVMAVLISAITWIFTDFYIQQKLNSLRDEALSIAAELSQYDTWDERYKLLESSVQMAAGTQLVLLSSSGEVLLSAGQLTGVSGVRTGEFVYQGNIDESNGSTPWSVNIPGGTISGWSDWILGGKVTDFFDGDNFLEVLSGKAITKKFIPKKALTSTPSVLISGCPIGDPAEGVVLLGTTAASFQDSIHAFNRIIITTSIVTVFLAAVVSYIFARQFTRPLALMHKGATRMAQGIFEPIVGVNSKDELGELAEAMNKTGESLRKHMDWLSQEKNLLQGIIESISDAVIMLGTDGSLVYANEPAKELWLTGGSTDIKRMEQILGFLRGKIEEQGIRFSKNESLSLYNDPQRDNQSLKENQDEDQNPKFVATSATLKLGSQMLAVALEPLNRSDSVQGYVAVLRDVTATLRAEKERRDFLASVTHELRTPLHLIQGYLEAIQDGVIPGEQSGEYINLVLDETNRLSRLVQELRDLEKLEAGNNLNFKVLRLEDLMQDIKYRFLRRSRELGIKLTIDSCNGELWGDRDRLLQVFINLLDNAFRHTPRGKEVGIKIEEKEGKYLIAVQDQGEGIPDAALGKIFERFYRVDKARSRKDGGMGLGLAIAKQIVESHGGNIRVTSKVGEGTTFWVELPKNRVEQH